MTAFAIHGHKPGKTGHTILGYLARDRFGVSLDELFGAANIEPRSARERKFHRLIASMLGDGLICKTRAGFLITETGRDALEALDEGAQPQVAQPTVRIFARSEA